MTRPRIARVVLSPHLDDAALSAWTLLGPAALVINVFTGAPLSGRLSLWDQICGFEDSVEVARLRVEEDAAALGALGTRVVNIGHRDMLVRKADRDEHPVEPAAIAGDVEETLVDLGVDPDVPVYAPLGGGPRAHVDHKIVRDAALILHRLGERRVSIYADQPYVYKNRAWPEWTADAIPDGSSRAVGPEADWWRRFPRALPDLVSLENRRRVRWLNGDERVAKAETMRAYATQYENLNTKLRTKDLLRDPDLYGIEVYWTLDPPMRREEPDG